MVARSHTSLFRRNVTSVASADEDTGGSANRRIEMMKTADPDTDDLKRIVLFGMECVFTASFMESLQVLPVADVAAIVWARTETKVQVADCSGGGKDKVLDNATV